MYSSLRCDVSYSRRPIVAADTRAESCTRWFHTAQDGRCAHENTSSHVYGTFPRTIQGGPCSWCVSPATMQSAHPDFLPGSIIGVKEESRIGVIHALWNYIKIQGLQDKVDRRMVRPDDRLRIVGCFFHALSSSLTDWLRRYSTAMSFHSSASLKS